MRITPVSFRSFAVQNINIQQRNISSNISFNGKTNEIDKNNPNYQDLIKEGYKIKKDILGKVQPYFIKIEPDFARMKVLLTDDNFNKIVEAEAMIEQRPGGRVAVLNIIPFKPDAVKQKGKEAYDFLFKEFDERNYHIARFEHMSYTEADRKFHKDCGFRFLDEDRIKLIK